MQKGMIILAGGVEILNRTKQRRAVELSEVSFGIFPGRFLPVGFFHRASLFAFDGPKG